MVRRFATLCIAFTLVPLLVLSGALPGFDSRAPNARGGTLGIDDELNDIQERLISGFVCTDTSLGKLRGDQTVYEAAIVQRAVLPFIYETFIELGFPFLLDIDDNLLAPAGYRGGAHAGRHQKHVG